MVCPCCWTSGHCLLVRPMVLATTPCCIFFCYRHLQWYGFCWNVWPSAKAPCTTAWTCCTVVHAHSNLAPVHVHQCIGERIIPRTQRGSFLVVGDIHCNDLSFTPQTSWPSSDHLCPYWQLGGKGFCSEIPFSPPVCSISSGSSGLSGSRHWDEVSSARSSL